MVEDKAWNLRLMSGGRSRHKGYRVPRGYEMQGVGERR